MARKRRTKQATPITAQAIQAKVVKRRQEPKKTAANKAIAQVSRPRTPKVRQRNSGRHVGSQIAFTGDFQPAGGEDGRQKFPLSKIARGIASSFGAPKWVDSAIGWGIPALGKFTGLPIGAQTGISTGAGSLSNVSAGQLIGAPASVGFVTRTPNWDFGRAPDLGCGPGIRVSGRLILGYVMDSFSAPTNFPFIGISAVEHSPDVLQAVMLSPVRGYNGDNIVSPISSFGAADNIIQDMAECWTRYRMVDATVIYQPFCSTSTDKSVTLAWVPDPELIMSVIDRSTGGTGDAHQIEPFADNDVVLGIPNSVTTPAWAPTTFVIPCDAKSSELLYVSAHGFEPPDVKDSDNDEQARFLFPGGFFITGFGANTAAPVPPALAVPTTLGAVFIDLTFDLYQLAVNTMPTFLSPDLHRLSPGTVDEKKTPPKFKALKSTKKSTRQVLPLTISKAVKDRQILRCSEPDTVMIPALKRGPDDEGLKEPPIKRAR